jgi:hypothetical protein
VPGLIFEDIKTFGDADILLIYNVTLV